MKKCDNCGFENIQQNAKFCPNCGNTFVNLNHIVDENESINIENSKTYEESREEIVNKTFEHILNNMDKAQKVYPIKNEEDLKFVMDYLRAQEDNDKALNGLLSLDNQQLPRIMRTRILEEKALKDKAWKEQKLEVLKYKLCAKYTMFCYRFRRNETMLNCFDQPSMIVDSLWNEVVNAKNDFYNELSELELDVNDFSILQLTEKELNDMYSKGETYRNLTLPKDKNGDPIGQDDPEDVKAFKEGLRKGKEEIERIKEEKNIENSNNEYTNNNSEGENKNKKNNKKNERAACGALGISLLLYFSDNLIFSGGFLKTLCGWFLTYSILYFIALLILPDDEKED